MNSVALIGNLGADAEVRYTGDGTPVANFRMATNEFFKNSAGENQKRTQWHRVVLWGKSAETLGQYLVKGKQVAIQGRLQTRVYDDKDGNKRYVTEVVARQVELLGGTRSDASVEQTTEASEDATQSVETDPAF